MQGFSFLSFVLCLCSLITAGCSQGGASDAPDTAPVSGKVTMNGGPLAGARVVYVNPTKTVQAVTSEDGTYSLPEGAIPGKNMVYISKIEGEGSVDEAMDAAQLEAMGLAGGQTPESGPKELVPEKYSDPALSELSFEVPEDGSTEANFDL